MISNPRPVIYTACFGDHDEPVDIPDLGHVADLVCFTDKPGLAEKLPHWHVFRRRSVFRTPRMDAKWFKMSACHLFPDREWSIYIDSSVRVKDPLLMLQRCHQAMPESESALALFEHPEDPHRSPEEEAAFSMTMGKYAGEPCIEQVAHYRAAGFPHNDPEYCLYAGGCIVRWHNERIANFEKNWFDECVHWSVQDQLSLPYVLWLNEITPGIIPGSIYDNEFLMRVWSGSER
jgi:hypothetical protein